MDCENCEVMQQELPKKYHFKAAWLNVGMALFAVVTLAFTVINAL